MLRRLGIEPPTIGALATRALDAAISAAEASSPGQPEPAVHDPRGRPSPRPGGRDDDGERSH